jgi:hypothetical protein
MKNLLRKLIPFLLLVPVFMLTGCYTQLGGVKGEDAQDEESYSQQDEYTDSAAPADQYAYDDYGNSRYPYGMSFYYPPYYDPWFYGSHPAYGFGYGYGYGYYDPIWWDYSPGPYYYGGGYGGYYPPYYGWAYGGGYNGYGHGTELRSSGTKRTIGNTRATGTSRSAESGYVPGSRGPSTLALPGSGSSRGSAVTPGSARTSTTRSGSPGSGVDRSGYGRTGSGSKGGSSSGTRSSTPQSRPSGGSSSRGSSSRGSGERSYTPPPPPPSNSGGSSGSGSSSGGSSRGSDSGNSSSGSSSSSGGSSRGGSRR